MPVVAHDAVAAQSHVNTLKSLGEDSFESDKVARLFKDAQFAVGTVDNVVNNAAC